MPNAQANISWISWFVMVMVTAIATCVVMGVKSKCYDRRARMPLLYGVDRNIMVGSNVIAITWLVAWARLLGTNVVRRFELLVLIDMCVGVFFQKWLLYTVHENDTAPYDGPGPLCGKNRARRIKLHYAITSMSAGSCAALSMAARPLAESHVCGYLFMLVAIPCIYAAWRTLLLDQPTAKGTPLSQTHQEEITNEFTIEGEDDDAGTDEDIDAPTAL